VGFKEKKKLESCCPHAPYSEAGKRREKPGTAKILFLEEEERKKRFYSRLKGGEEKGIPR